MTDLDIELFEQDLLGDAATTEMATGAAGELLASIGKTVATSQAKKEADKRAKASEADIKAAQDARRAATKAALIAQSEKEPTGKLHMAAIDAEMRAQELEAKVGISSQTGLAPYGQQPSGQNPFTAVKGGLPVYGWLLVGAGSIGVIALLASMLRKK